MRITKQTLKDLVYQVNGSAIEVHKELGPGLLEKVYHKFMKQEVHSRNLEYSSKMIIPVPYKGAIIDTELRCDMFVENMLVVEFKAVEKILPIHKAQLLTYMKLLKAPMGLLINFNVTHIFKEGQQTFVNEIYRNLPEY